MNLGMNVGIGVQTSFGISEGVSAPTPAGIYSVGSSQSVSISGNSDLLLHNCDSEPIPMDMNATVILFPWTGVRQLSYSLGQEFDS